MFKLCVWGPASTCIVNYNAVMYICAIMLQCMNGFSLEKWVVGGHHVIITNFDIYSTLW